MTKVLKINKDEKFWDWIKLEFPINSLAFFLTKEGETLLKDKSFEYKIFLNKQTLSLVKEIEEVKYDEVNHGEKYIPSKKKEKSKLDFLS